MSPLPAILALLALGVGGLGVREILRGANEPEVPNPRKLSGPDADRTEDGNLLGLGERVRQAGLEGVVLPRTVLLAKGCCAAFGMVFGSLFTSVMPGRLAPLILLALVVAGFLTPDFFLERHARKRHRRMVVALPDVLDLLAVSVQTGRGIGGCLLDLKSAGRGPLILEMARAGDDIAWGSGQAAALEDLRKRIGGSEITSFVSTLERSRRLGSPLAEQLRRQSASLRQDQRRSIEEEAARAAPKIQLVIALILVPSVLLLIVAALVANADSLLNVGY